MDLRRRADEYKRRARGTHFSREHVAAILDAKRQPKSVKKAWEEEEDEGSRSDLLTPRNETQEEEEEEEEELTPRVVLPKKESPSKHHLARTTPCKGELGFAFDFRIKGKPEFGQGGT